MNLLEVHGIEKHFGGVFANNDISFDVRSGEVLGLIGPNGSGKSTLFDLITGFQRPEKGEITFDGSSLIGLPPHRINKLGIARTFQKLRLFLDMTVEDNVLTAALPRRATVGQARQRALELIGFVGLEDKTASLAATLSTGQRKRLEVARAMATDPRLLMMDEPAGGVDPQRVRELTSLIHQVKNAGITLLLIEHNMRLVMTVCDRLIVLEGGRKILEGLPRDVTTHPDVLQAYLGTRSARG